MLYAEQCCHFVLPTGKYSYQAWELQGMDIDEEEEDAEAERNLEPEPDEEEENEEEEDPNRSIKKPLGDTNHFCPVALKEQDILWPGNPEVTAKYRERYYYCSTNEAREKFIADPTFYLPKGKPPKVGLFPSEACIILCQVIKEL